MTQEIFTTINAGDGSIHTYILKEKINNGNGQLLYRFRHEDENVEHLLTKDGETWRSLNPGEMHPEVFEQLCAFASSL